LKHISMSDQPTPTDGSDGSAATFTSIVSSAATSAVSTDPSVPTPAQAASSKRLAEWVALGVVGIYGLLFLIIIVNWAILRIRNRDSKNGTNSLPPEATEKGKNAFLVPTPAGAHDPYRGEMVPPGSRGGGGSRPRANTAGSVAPRRPNRPPGLQLQNSDASSVRSGFYTNNGGGSAPGSRSASPSNPFANPANMYHSRSPLAGSDFRPSSANSGRFYHADGGGFDPPRREPQMPPIAHMGGYR
jgi:hypothetical protein